MTMTLVARHAVLLRKIVQRPSLEVWLAYQDGAEVEAVAYPELTGPLMAGDRVLVNTTAVELALGTGGQHFIMSRAEPGGPVPPPAIRREDGHILKLRYTPLQFRVHAAEEETSPYHAALSTMDHLPGTPVVCLGLHSQLAPVLGGIKAANPALRVAYLMTDSAALAAAYSNLLASLREQGHLACTVTCGQAFGGDFETVNIYSGLATAVVAGQADIIIAGQGPGNVGTATALGFGGIEQAQLLNAVAALCGRPLAVPRISFADARSRHFGFSHHSLTVLQRLTLAQVYLPLPMLPVEQQSIIQQQFDDHALVRHLPCFRDGQPGIDWCRAARLSLRSMGRGLADDPAFFLAAAAAGDLAASLLNDNAALTEG